MNVAVVVNPPSMSLAALDTANLMIDEIVSHRVFARDASKVAKPPQLKDKLLFLPREGIDALQQRLTTSLGSKSHGVELSIESTGPGSFVQVGAHAIARLKTPDFIESSRAMATMLASAQASTSGLAGMVFVIRGRMGISPKRFAAVIKAEVHDGFGAGDDAPESDVTYLRNLALTPTQRLYKVGLLLELVPSLEQVPGTYSVSNYRAFLFDHLITATETKAAAAYFYSGFLGMDIQKSSKKLTQDFYEYTTAFIASSPLPEEDRWELREALRVELRSNSAIISVGDFACQYIDDEDLRDSFENFMESRDFPKNAVHKDVEYVKAKLRRPRRMSFTSGVKVIIPADAEREVVKVVEENDSQVTLVVRGSMTLE